VALTFDLLTPKVNVLSLALLTTLPICSKTGSPLSKRRVHKFDLPVTLTYDLLTPKVDLFIPLLCAPLEPIFNIFTRLVTNERTDGRMDERRGRQYHAFAKSTLAET